MRFLLGAKPDDHEHLFDEVSKAEAEGRATTLRWTDAKKEEVQCEIRFAHDLPLNKSNADLLVNFLQYTEYASDGSIRKRFSWVTDLTITCDNASHLVRGGRARWKIENETFNTLKNQDYHFEHNFGHGEQNLSVVFAMLMMLAFLVDQNTGILLSPVSSRSQKTRQPTIVVGPPTFPLPSLPLRIHAAAAGSHPLRLGQGDANSLLRITPSGESSLSPFSSQHRAVFSWRAATSAISALARCVLIRGQNRSYYG